MRASSHGSRSLTICDRRPVPRVVRPRPLLVRHPALNAVVGHGPIPSRDLAGKRRSAQGLVAGMLRPDRPFQWVIVCMLTMRQCP